MCSRLLILLLVASLPGAPINVALIVLNTQGPSLPNIPQSAAPPIIPLVFVTLTGVLSLTFAVFRSFKSIRQNEKAQLLMEVLFKYTMYTKTFLFFIAAILEVYCSGPLYVAITAFTCSNTQWTEEKLLIAHTRCILFAFETLLLGAAWLVYHKTGITTSSFMDWANLVLGKYVSAMRQQGRNRANYIALEENRNDTPSGTGSFSYKLFTEDDWDQEMRRFENPFYDEDTVESTTDSELDDDDKKLVSTLVASEKHGSLDQMKDAVEKTFAHKTLRRRSI